MEGFELRSEMDSLTFLKTHSSFSVGGRGEGRPMKKLLKSSKRRMMRTQTRVVVVECC